MVLTAHTLDEHEYWRPPGLTLLHRVPQLAFDSLSRALGCRPERAREIVVGSDDSLLSNAKDEAAAAEGRVDLARTVLLMRRRGKPND